MWIKAFALLYFSYKHLDEENKMAEEIKRGKLYLCPTPIGNLEDMTFRVIRTLKECDEIAAEDTRNSIKLLNHFEIDTPMTSYHEFNKYDKGRVLVDEMLKGKSIALITDAGTPGISDPGEVLVQLCYEAGIEVTSLPGACAATTALTMSGFATRRFCFEAFLPQDKKEQKEILEDLRRETRTIVLYEAPHRLVRTLELLSKDFGDRRAVTIKELTKKHEKRESGTVSELLEFYKKNEPKGEFVIVIEGKKHSELLEEEQQQWESISLEEHMKLYMDKGMSKKEAMKQVAVDRGVPKREIYAKLLESEEN
jgi:16S rRNA (cytidine1402-2'-O)-methyltransferase